MGHLVERTVAWQNIEVRLQEGDKLIVTDYSNDASELIDFRDRLTDMSVGFNYLIAVTDSQCYVYNVESLLTPYNFDLKEKVKLILTCPKYFALIDESNLINVSIQYYS